MRWIIYSPWLPGWAFLFLVLPPFHPLIAKLFEKNKASETAMFLADFARLDAAYYYLPAFAVFHAFVTTNESVLYLFRRRTLRAGWCWRWSISVGFLGVLLDWYLYAAIYSNVFVTQGNPRH